MRRPDDRAQVVRILHAVQHNVQSSAGHRFFQRGESPRRCPNPTTP